MKTPSFYNDLRNPLIYTRKRIKTPGRDFNVQVILCFCGGYGGVFVDDPSQPHFSTPQPPWTGPQAHEDLEVSVCPQVLGGAYSIVQCVSCNIDSFPEIN